MVHYVQGDIFSAGTKAIVNTVNTEGIMGKGLALQFKKRFPDNFKAYERACKNGQVRMGRMFITSTNLLNGWKYIINFPTKRFWRNKSRLSDIQDGLQDLAAQIAALNIRSIAIPPLGCGLGGLRWTDVQAAIERALNGLPGVDIYVYEPLEGKNPAPQPGNTGKTLSLSQAILLTAFRRYMVFATATELTFVEAHKLAYLLQECGTPLNLKFAPWRYGPYANNLRFVLGALETRWIERYRDGTPHAFDTFRLLPASAEAETRVAGRLDAESLNRLDRLYAGFESLLGLELLGTVHWLIARDRIPPELAAVRRGIAGWCGNKDGYGDRKIRLFQDAWIQEAITRVECLREDAPPPE